MKTFVAVVALSFGVVAFTGCEYASKARASDASWTTTLQGQGGQIVGGSVGFAAATPAPTPWALAGNPEQLEKGNARQVAAQISEKARLDAMALSSGAAPGTACPGGVCPVPTPAPRVVESRSPGGTRGAAWYNGFLP